MVEPRGNPVGQTRLTGQVRAPGHPRPRALLRDGVKATFAQPVASIAAMLVVALVCLIVLVTAGRTAATEQAVLASIDDTGSRLITVIDSTGNAEIRPQSVAATADLPGVTWSLGLGPAEDAVIDAPGSVTGRLPTGIPVRQYVGTLPPDAVLVAGRLPQRAGEAVASTSAANRLGLLDGAGPVVTTSRDTSVVGVVELVGGLTRFADTVLVATDVADAELLRFVYIVADNTSDVPAVAATVEAAIWAGQPQQVTIGTPAAVMALRDVISGQLGASSRQLMAGTLGVGVIVVGVTMLGMVSAKRRDFGRRRALGASRSAIIVLVLVQAAIAACIGASIGTLAGLGIVAATGDALPAPGYVAGLATLTILAALLGSIPPAILAARRDPVRILRVP